MNTDMNTKDDLQDMKDMLNKLMQNKTTNAMQCDSCSRKDHDKWACTYSPCFLCHEKGHIPMLCIRLQDCQICHQPGHNARNCRANIVCSSCGKQGHVANVCRSRNDNF